MFLLFCFLLDCLVYVYILTYVEFVSGEYLSEYCGYFSRHITYRGEFILIIYLLYLDLHIFIQKERLLYIHTSVCLSHNNNKYPLGYCSLKKMKKYLEGRMLDKKYPTGHNLTQT